MKSLGLENSNPIVFQLVEDMDKNMDTEGNIDFDGFLDLMTGKMVRIMTFSMIDTCLLY